MLELLRGVAVSPGVGRGTAYVLANVERDLIPRRELPVSALPGEVARFDGAVTKAESELLLLRSAVDERIGTNEANIFAAQALVLKDPAFRNQVTTLIEEHKLNAEAALADVIDKFTHAFDQIPDPYLRERAVDVRDVGRRLLRLLVREHGPEHLDIPRGAVVVADELLPSLTARLELGDVSAFVTARGGKFSHTSILARSQGMPAVVGVADAPRRIKTGDRLIIDGFAGLVLINPTPSVEREYARLELEIQAGKEKLRELLDLPAVTQDGTSIGLFANVSKFADAEAALLHKADGIGLYRTEFTFSIRNALPTEDEQYEFLKRAAERFHPRPVVFRLLDVGGDKELSYLPLPASRNPSLGQRGIRFLLEHPEILERQLRAFLRVSAEHPVSILVPVVGGLEEIRATRKLLRQVEAQLRAEPTGFDPQVRLGAMIELPSAALMVKSLAREVDFFSLGTNDLVQYMLAADREDENIASYYRPLHPAVLGLIRSVAQTAKETGRDLGICGDMAGNPVYTELLLGLGLREFSVAPGELLDIKKRIRSTTLAEAEALAQAALELASADEIEALIEQRTRATGRMV